MQGNRLRVGLVCGGFQPRQDGVSDYIRCLTAALSTEVDPLIVTRAPHEPAAVPIVAPVQAWHAAEVRTVARTLRDLRVDVVHVQFAPVAFDWQTALCALPRLLAPLRIVVTAHEFEPDMRALFSDADAIVATTDEHAARILDCDPSLRSRVCVIPIGPNVTPASGMPEARAAEARQRAHIPPEAPLVVFFGFLHPVKGLEYLIRAAAMARRALPALHLVLAGGWRSLALPDAEGDDYRDQLQERIREAQLERAVRITGFLPEDEVSALLYAADLVVLPFTYGLSFKSGTFLAALAHGRPVIGTLGAQSAPSHAVLAVPPRDADALAHAMLNLLGDADRRERLALAGLRAVQARTWPAIAAQHLGLYARLG